MKQLLLGACALALISTASHAAHHEEHHMDELRSAAASMKDGSAMDVGTVTLTEGANGLLADIDLTSLPTGWHAIHIHETGDCSKDDFTSAGGHAGGKHHSNHYGDNHGFLTGDYQHKGDMPNIYTHSDGTTKAHYFLPKLTLADIQDEDGAAIIVHKGKDDYKSQPSGAAGARIACGVIK